MTPRRHRPRYSDAKRCILYSACLASILCVAEPMPSNAQDTCRVAVSPEKLPSNGLYTIQQEASGRYLDAHGGAKADYAAVTRPVQANDTQRWMLTNVGGNTYTIQQKVNGRYLDAHEGANAEYAAVTRPVQANDTQRWMLIPARLRIVDVYFDLDGATIRSSRPEVMCEVTLPNSTKSDQSAVCEVAREVSEESYFESRTGLAVTVGTQFSVTLPGGSAGGKVEYTASVDLTYGERNSLSRSITQTYPLVARPGTTVTGKAVGYNMELDVPYRMKLVSEDGETWCEEGIWRGMSVSKLMYTTYEEPKQTPK